MILALILFAAVVLAIAIVKGSDFLNTWDAWEIKEGRHHSKRTGLTPKFVSLKDGRHLRFDAYFDDSCLYDAETDDINKLYGFTDANSLVHENSVRFGWRHDNAGVIEIFAYWYVNGERNFQKLGETEPYQEDEYEMWAKNGYYYFRFNEVEFTTVRTVDNEHGLRVRLFPYFGGDQPAPNDMLIFIHEYK